MATESQPSGDRTDSISQRHQETAADVIPPNLKLYIGGDWVSSSAGETFETRDPTTGETLATVQAGTREDIDRAVEAAWTAYDETWSDYSAAERQRVLEEIAARVEENREAFARLETLDNGKPISEARIDMELVADHFRYFAGATRVNGGETIPSGDGQHVQTIREPYGVVGQIIPWNFPLLMAAWKLGPALAAGNCSVLKPAEETPLTVLKLMNEIDDVLPDGVVNVVTGFGPDAGEPLAKHPDIRKIAFTGSTEVGKQVMTQAAEHVHDITLELGGKSPLIIYPDADLEKAVATTITAIFYNTGECCSAGSRLFVHSDIKDEFLEELASTAEDLTVDDPLLEETTLGPKVTEEQAERTLEYIEEARDAGADFLTGGDVPDDEALAEGSFVSPTLIDDIDHDNRAVQEEIFGPVQEVFEWTDYETMIELANDVDYGLAAGIITNDITKAYETATDIEAGNVWINQYNAFPAGMPFGGYKQSGIGREVGYEALAEHYTQTKTINLALE
ncbi:aldehyde dehydrogenase family protein [Haloterrigena sp. SYSU A558-1]|uniref:Aldehyde dehydrogenase family protein n=1 Tax=Haloterrigena gelatinilytica TaxID=2741724 RepID=A0A8J8GGE9_9EURY|nr:aldehyde dehydrogenase family protein [Haloterrigena gelatinilytica]NUB89449.1 aldehyde dehydrogenase family protein [Haloterrigena gelatinilytica]NUC74717.1 aldehyde dehydrogenase family protein [Haloterrigena gelatinilytica]